MSDLQAERQQALASFHDPHASPLAAVARHDFPADGLLTFELDGKPVTLKALKDGFEYEGKKLPPGAKVSIGRYTLRLSHQNFPAVVVLDPESPRLKTGPFPKWFEPDEKLRVEARLVRAEKPEEITILSTRGNRRHALKVGALEFTLDGKPARLTATRLLEPGVKDTDLAVFFRDATTGHESYPVGRYVEPEHVEGDRYVLDFNRAYNPTCAFSTLYNCPIPPRENVLSARITAGERDPGGH